MFRFEVEAQQREYQDEIAEVQETQHTLPARFANLTDDQKEVEFEQEEKSAEGMEDKRIKETEEEQKRFSKLMPWEIKEEQDSVRILIDSEKLAGILQEFM